MSQRRLRFAVFWRPYLGERGSEPWQRVGGVVGRVVALLYSQRALFDDWKAGRASNRGF